MSTWLILCFALPVTSSEKKQIKNERAIDLDNEQYVILKRVIESCIPYNEVWAYGSRVKWNASERADLDLVVLGSNSDALSDFRDALEESDLLISVDVMDWENISDDFKENIKKKYVVVQKKILPTGWQAVKLGDICLDISYGYTASASNEAIGPKFLRITDIVPEKINWATVPYCKIEDKNRGKYLLNKGDIVIARTGATTGYNKIIKDDVQSIFASYLIRYKVDSKIAYPSYIGHVLQSSNWKSFIYGVKGGSAQPGANAKQLGSFKIILPTLSEQKSIAEVLSSLDDKIDLLHCQNKTLESMAQTLFHKWFMGDVDNDWEVLKLSDIAEVKNGYSFSNKNYIEYTLDALEVLKMGHIKKGGGLRTNPKKDYAPRDENLKRHILNKGDIVMAMTDMKDNVVILGVPAMTDKNNHYVLNQRVARIYLKANDKLINNYLLYIQLKDKNNIAILQGKANRGVQVNLSIQAIRDIEILVPPIQIQQKKGATIADLYLKKENNDCQIHTLAKLRDLLLPKLMSGKIKVN